MKIHAIAYEDRRKKKRRILTCGGVHGTAITDDKAISREALTQLEKGILNLEHRPQQVLLKFECCKHMIRDDQISI